MAHAKTLKRALRETTALCRSSRNDTIPHTRFSAADIKFGVYVGLSAVLVLVATAFVMSIHGSGRAGSHGHDHRR